MFMPTPFNIVLIATIYILHRSFHKVDMAGFAISVTIALSANFYMTKYLHAPQIAAMAITIIIFPILETLWAVGIKNLHKEAEIHHWHMPHPHMSAPTPPLKPKKHGRATHPPH